MSLGAIDNSKNEASVASLYNSKRGCSHSRILFFAVNPLSGSLKPLQNPKTIHLFWGFAKVSEWMKDQGYTLISGVSPHFIRLPKGSIKNVGNSGQTQKTMSPSTKAVPQVNPIDEPVFNPKGSVGSAHSWSITARIQYAKLPRQGRIRYILPKNYSPSAPLPAPLPKGPNNGYLDKFGNEWTKGPSRTKSQEFEWDVQLSKTGREQLGWASRDGKHLNISIDGKITHK